VSFPFLVPLCGISYAVVGPRCLVLGPPLSLGAAVSSPGRRSWLNRVSSFNPPRTFSLFEYDVWGFGFFWGSFFGVVRLCSSDTAGGSSPLRTS